MKTSLAALEHSIADHATDCKRGKRANDALERANFAAKWPFSVVISVTDAVLEPFMACETGLYFGKIERYAIGHFRHFCVRLSDCPVFKGFKVSLL